MVITILGSGTGVPTRERAAPALVIRTGEQTLLLDSGPGTLRRLLRLGLTYHDIDYICYTHFHVDHTLDLAAILFAARYPLSLRTKKLEIIAGRGLKQFYQDLLGLYADTIRPQAYELSLRETCAETIASGDLTIETKGMVHAPESIGFRIESAGKTVVYSGDTQFCQNIIELGRGCDLLILECSFHDEMRVAGHLTPQDAGKIAQSCDCAQLVLTHLYPVAQAEEIKRQVQKIFRGETIVASDLLQLTF